MKRTLSLFLCLCLLTACAAGDSPASDASTPTEATESAANTEVAADAEFTAQVFAMDTYMDLKAYGPAAEAALAAAQERLTALDALFSATTEGSDVSRLNAAAGEPVTVDAETFSLIQQAVALGASTDGALDITLYPLSKAWGFPTQEYAIPDEATIQALLAHVDSSQIVLDEAASTVQLPEGMELDLGAVAKGYAGDVLAADLKAAGVTSALLNLGGSTIRVVGSKPDGSEWRIALQDPEDESAYAGGLALTDAVVDTSGGYERYFVGEDGVTYWHILDPETGAPARSGVISATIISENGLAGDGLSTACFVMGVEDTIAYWRAQQDFEFILITDAHELYVSEGIADSFEPLGNYADAPLTVVTYEEG